MDIKIITAEEARRNSEEYIPKRKKEMIGLVMNEIERVSKNTPENYVVIEECDISFDSFITFNDLIKDPYYKDFFEKLGYKYNIETESRSKWMMEDKNKIIISW